MFNPEETMRLISINLRFFWAIGLFQLIFIKWNKDHIYIFLMTHLTYLTTSAISINNYLKYITGVYLNYLEYYVATISETSISVSTQIHRMYVCVKFCLSMVRLWLWLFCFECLSSRKKNWSNLVQSIDF